MPPEMPLSPLWGSPSAQQSRVPGKDAGISRLCRGPKVPATPVAVCCQPSPSLPMWARLLSSLHPSQPSFFLGHSLFREAGLCWGSGLGPSAPRSQRHSLWVGSGCLSSVPSTPGQASVSLIVDAPTTAGQPTTMGTDSEPSWVQITALPLAGCAL